MSCRPWYTGWHFISRSCWAPGRLTTPSPYSLLLSLVVMLCLYQALHLNSFRQRSERQKRSSWVSWALIVVRWRQSTCQSSTFWGDPFWTPVLSQLSGVMKSFCISWGKKRGLLSSKAHKKRVNKAISAEQREEVATIKYLCYFSNQRETWTY